MNIDALRRRLAGAAMTGLSLIMIGASAVQAAPIAGTPIAARPDFTGQRSALGVTESSARALQASVDWYLATMGGTQVAINEIRGDDFTVLLPAPGETQARQVAYGKVAAFVCNLGHMCAYEFQWSGAVIDMVRCHEDRRIPWTSVGSWHNNQTRGTQAQFKDNQLVTRFTSPGAPSSDATPAWDWVYAIRACSA